MTPSQSQPESAATSGAEPSAAFTAGPWQVSGVRQKLAGLPYLMVGPDGNWIAAVPYSDNTPDLHLNSHADARLIAAAPDGYKLAETILRLAYVEELSTHVEVSFEAHDAALLLHLAGKLVAKALGADPKAGA